MVRKTQRKTQRKMRRNRRRINLKGGRYGLTEQKVSSGVLNDCMRGANSNLFRNTPAVASLDDWEKCLYLQKNPDAKEYVADCRKSAAYDKWVPKTVKRNPARCSTEIEYKSRVGEGAGMSLKDARTETWLKTYQDGENNILSADKVAEAATKIQSMFRKHTDFNPDVTTALQPGDISSPAPAAAAPVGGKKRRTTRRRRKGGKKRRTTRRRRKSH